MANESKNRRPYVTIDARAGRAHGRLKELRSYMDLFVFLVRRDLLIRYKQTLLGVTWVILQPFAMMIVFTIFFGFLARFDSADVPYPLFCYSGLLLWGFVHRSVTSSAESLVRSPEMLTKVYFPRILMPAAPVVLGLIDLVVAGSLLILLMFFYGCSPSVRMLAAPLFIGLAAMASLGMGLIFSALNVRFRDVTVILPFITQVWMFLTPTFYPISLIPERFRYIWALNPLVGTVQGFRWALFGTDPGSWLLVAIGFFSAAVLMITGVTYFLKAEEIFPDII